MSIQRGFVPTILFAVGLAAAVPLRGDAAGHIPPADSKAIAATIEAYRAGWLAGDADRVLKTFTEDAVLLPHHGDPPVVGITAIRAYWFGSAGTTIDGLTITVEETMGEGSLAFVRGHDSVKWSSVEHGATRHWSNSGTYLNVMTKMADGSWRIRAHMWDDPANQAGAQ